MVTRRSERVDEQRSAVQVDDSSNTLVIPSSENAWIPEDAIIGMFTSLQERVHTDVRPWKCLVRARI